MFSLLLFFACGEEEKTDTAAQEAVEEVVDTSVEEETEEAVEGASEEGGE